MKYFADVWLETVSDIFGRYNHVWQTCWLERFSGVITNRENADDCSPWEQAMQAVSWTMAFQSVCQWSGPSDEVVIQWRNIRTLEDSGPLSWCKPFCTNVGASVDMQLHKCACVMMVMRCRGVNSELHSFEFSRNYSSICSRNKTLFFRKTGDTTIPE